MPNVAIKVENAGNLPNIQSGDILIIDTDVQIEFDKYELAFVEKETSGSSDKTLPARILGRATATVSEI